MTGMMRMWVRPACTLYICTYSIQIYIELKLGDGMVWRDKREYVSAVRVER